MTTEATPTLPEDCARGLKTFLGNVLSLALHNNQKFRWSCKAVEPGGCVLTLEIDPLSIPECETTDFSLVENK